jgi:hypothetical protein
MDFQGYDTISASYFQEPATLHTGMCTTACQIYTRRLLAGDFLVKTSATTRPEAQQEIDTSNPRPFS